VPRASASQAERSDPVDASAELEEAEPDVAESARLTRGERRDALLDVAVAERAGVSRALVYKHFANRSEILAAVYRREATYLHRRLAREVAAAESVEGMFRALIHGALHAAGERGHLFAALRSAGGWNRELRHEQRARDVDTVRAFAARAVRELGIDRRDATAATAALLATIEPVLTQWRLRPTPENAALLEDIYLGMVQGVFRRMRR
jgi:AcrR family transcriptional regulator